MNTVVMDRQRVKEQSPSFGEKDDVIDWDNIRVSCLNPSVRTTNCLRSADIFTMGDLIRMKVQGVDSLMRLPNFGQRCLEELTESMGKLGFRIENKKWVQVHTPLEIDRRRITMHCRVMEVGPRKLPTRVPKIDQLLASNEGNEYFISRFQGVIKMAVEFDELVNLRDQIDRLIVQRRDGR